MGRSIIIMGVSGAGKTTVATAISDFLNIKMVEGDDFHPNENIEKMRQGISLKDSDRWPWLDQLSNYINEDKSNENDVVVSCSALKNSYREYLNEKLNRRVSWVYLDIDMTTAFKRLTERKDHFFNPVILEQQFMDLEKPKNVIKLNANLEISQIVEIIVRELKHVE